MAVKDVGAVKARVTSLHLPLETARSAMGQETVQSAKVPAEADYLISVSYPLASSFLLGVCHFSAYLPESQW